MYWRARWDSNPRETGDITRKPLFFGLSTTAESKDSYLTALLIEGESIAFSFDFFVGLADDV
jgi:hypothetical protein